MTNRTTRSASARRSQPPEAPTPVNQPQEDHPMEEAPQDNQVVATQQATQDTPQGNAHNTPQSTTEDAGVTQTQPPVSNIQVPTRHPQVDSVLVQLNERVEYTARHLLQAQGQSRAEHEEAMRQHHQAQEARAMYQRTLANANTNQSSSKEDQIVPSNMPMLQIKGGPLRDANKVVHESVQAFFTSFEAQLRSRSLDLNRHWERLIWTTLDSQQHQ